MLIVPIHQGWSRKDLPLLTLGLIVINAFIFFGFQVGDAGKAWARAASYYAGSGLVDLEYPRYRHYLERSADTDQLAYLESVKDQPEAIFALIESDAEFQRRLHANIVIPVDHPDWPAWSAQRARLKEILDQDFSRRYALAYHEPQAIQWLSHMFLHGNFAHLFGNMLFLFLIGMLVEPALRVWAYLGAYVLCGFVAAAGSLAVHAGEPGMMLGASGAIAGLMGMFTTLFWTTRIRFLYWAFVYFDYVWAPALVLLPAWLGWELVQWMFVEGNVAYEAHAAGIVAGALVGIGLRRLGIANVEFVESQSQERHTEAPLPSLDEVRLALRKVELDTANQLIGQILRRFPDDDEAWDLQYRIARFVPASERFHNAARWRLLKDQNASPEDLSALWADYREATGGKIRLAPSQLIRLASRIAHADLTQAVRLYKTIRARAPETPGLGKLALELRQRAASKR